VKVKGETVTITPPLTGGDSIEEPVDLGVVSVDQAKAANSDLETSFTPASGEVRSVFVLGGADYSTTAFDGADVYADGPLTGGGAFLVKVTASDGTTEKWHKITVTVPGTTTAEVKTGDNKLLVTKTDVTYESGIQVFVNDAGTEVLITKTAPTTGYTNVTANADISGDDIDITLTAASATVGGGKLKAEALAIVVLADDAHSGVTAITAGSYDSSVKYTVRYDKNGGNEVSGNVPEDSLSPYDGGATVTVLGNIGSLAKAGHTFGGWTKANDPKVYKANDTFRIFANTILSAVWTQGSGDGPIVIEANDLAAAIQTPYNTPPNQAATSGTAAVNSSGPLQSASVSLAGVASFVGGSTQTITIILNAADDYTFTGAQTAITWSDVVGAVLDPAVFLSGSVTDGSVNLTPKALTVTATYTKPFSAAELAQQLANSANFSGKSSLSLETATVTLTADVSLTTTTVDVPAGVTLVVPEVTGTPITLTVGTGKTLTVAGKIEVVGEVVVEGTFADNKGTLEVASGGKLNLVGKLTIEEYANLDVFGLYEVAESGTGQNDGTITIKDGGKTLGNGGGKSGGTGKTVIEKGGVAANMLKANNDPSDTKKVEIPLIGPAGMTAPFKPVLQLDNEDSEMILTADNYTLIGEARLTVCQNKAEFWRTLRVISLSERWGT
jgi:hypothetical protein